MIGLAGALAGFALGYLLCLRARLDRDQEPVHRRQPAAARLFAAALPVAPARSRWPPRWPPATCRRARPRASIRSTSSGARHERAATPARARRADRRAADRGARRHPHPARHRADHAGARHRPASSATTNSSPSPGRPARASRRCSICSACSICRPSGEVLIRGRATAHMDEAERACTRLSHAGLRVPVPFPAAGIHGPRQRHAADARARTRCRPTPCANAARDAARLARARRSCAQAAGPALRRPAPARRRGARARQRSADHPGRRADRLARFASRASRCSRLLRDLVDQHGKTVVAVTHDLGLAAAHGPPHRAAGRRHC